MEDPLREAPVRLLDAISRTGTRDRLVETLLDAQEGPSRVQRGFDEMVDDEA